MRPPLLSWAFAALLLTGCQSSTAPSDRAAVDSLTALPRALSTAETQGVAANNRFALSLLREAARTRPNNVLLSPLSVSYALGLTMNGAEQETLTEMMATLGWGTRPRAEINAAYRDLAALLPSLDPSVTMRLANGIWLRRPYTANPAFVSDAQTFFGAPVQTLSTPQQMYDSVNAWGNRRTDGMIPKVLEGTAPQDLVMLLANATYFAGEWREQFTVAETQPRPFTLESGTSVSVPTMHRTTGTLRATGSPAVTAIELSYGNSAWSPTSQSLASYAATLTDASFDAIVRALTPQTRAELYLPKFTVSSNLELSRELASLGMPRAFTDAAQFPRLVDEATKLAFVQHAVKVAVDERGTKAAAVTVVGVVPVSAPAPWVVNRPFVFVIRERLTGTIAFAGLVRDPR
jgi:serpin B